MAYINGNEILFSANVNITNENGAATEIIINEQSGGYYNIQGEWYEDANFNSKYTDLIPIEERKKYLYRGLGVWNVASILWYSNENDLLSYEQHGEWGETPNAVIVTPPIGAKFVRFCSFNGNDSVPVLEVSLFEEETPISSLAGKKIVYDGDSICYGAGHKGGYAQLIADKVRGSFENQAAGGGRLITAGADGTYHSVVDNLINLPTDGDLYCFEGGINDYWTKGVLGTYDHINFDGELDTSTVCGALETIFRYALNTFVGKPICFIITHKIQGTAYTDNSNGDSFKDYHDAMVGICEKYSIPYYDAFLNSGLNGWNTAQNNAFLTGNSAGTPDGCHPNEQGYKRYYVPQLISLFERIMPIDVTDIDIPTEPTYTNVLDTVGYTNGVYLTGEGVEGVDENSVTTGYIRVTEKCTIYLKNITMPNESSHGNRIACYDTNKVSLVGAMPLTSDKTEMKPVFDIDGNLTSFYLHITGMEYLRLSAWNIDETSIITVNEPIE